MLRPPKQLVHEWNEKLKASGFRDIEVYRNGEYILKPETGSERRFRQKSNSVIENRAYYFTLVEQKLGEQSFQSPGELITMHLHAEGFSNRKIAKALGVPKTLIRDRVSRCIRKWLSFWKIYP